MTSTKQWPIFLPPPPLSAKINGQRLKTIKSAKTWQISRNPHSPILWLS